MAQIEKLVEVMREMKRSDRVSVSRYRDEIAALTTKQAVDIAELVKTISGLDCAPGVRDALIIGDEIYIHWDAKQSGSPGGIVGEFHLTSPMLFAEANLIGEPFVSDAALDVDLTVFRMFDDAPNEGGPLSAHLKVEGGTITDAVFIFDEEDEQFYASDLTYATYMEALALTRGIRFWQYLYVKPDDLLPSIKASLAASLAFLKEAFPGDYGDLDARFARLPG